MTDEFLYYIINVVLFGRKKDVEHSHHGVAKLMKGMIAQLQNEVFIFTHFIFDFNQI